MGPQVDVVIPDPDMPAEADVVIIGGGIIGTSAALFLAKRGVKVVLCEKGHIAGEQSSRNWGWVRKARRDPREIPLIVESLRQWERMNETIGDETGFRTTGSPSRPRTTPTWPATRPGSTMRARSRSMPG